jgi:DNA repair exonuclease SbcCD nuclease subunit
VFVIPGNHDPLVPGSVWQHPAWGGAANLHVLIEARPAAVPGGTLFPCPLFEKHSRKDPTAWIRAGEPEGIAVGMAHGTPAWIDPADPDYPIPPDAAARGGLDYLALGHWHSTVTYADPSGAVRMAFSGTHETTKFGERDSGNVLLVEIASRGDPPRVTPLRTGGLAWRTVEQAIRGPGELAQVRAMVEGLPDPQRTLLQLTLTGVLSAAEQGEVKRIEELAAARLLFSRIDVSRLLPEPGDDAWLALLPGGVLLDAARELQRWTDPGAADRPPEVTPETAARALVELYALVQEAEA